MARPFRPRQQVGRSRRKSTWVASVEKTDLVLLAANTLLIDQTLTAAQILSFGLIQSTIVRTRGLLSVVSDQTIAGEFPFGAMGMAIVSEQARAAGAASIPDPYTDSQWDGWFVHQFFQTSCLVGTNIGFDASAGYQFEFDSKAMRKVADNEALVVMMTNASATDGLLYMLDFRQLYKLA